MPLADGDVQGHDRAIGHEVDGVSKPAILVIKQFLQMSAETDHSLGSVSMPMNRKWAAWFDRIQHSLGAALVRVPQIVIHPKPRRCHRLGGQFIQHLLVDNPFKRAFRLIILQKREILKGPSYHLILWGVIVYCH